MVFLLGEKIRPPDQLLLTNFIFFRRGHAILTIHVDSRVNDKGNNPLNEGNESLLVPNVLPEASLKLGKLQFIDLASAERVGESKINGEQLADALYINKSLSALSKISLLPLFLLSMKFVCF